MKPHDPLDPKYLRYVLADGLATTAYAVYTMYDEPEKHATIVYADNVETAIRLGAAELGECAADCCAYPSQDFQKYCADYVAATVEERADVLRLEGWHLEDEDHCESCNLAPMGRDEYALCGTCCICKECHGEECDAE